jgi:hypothetical protein
MFNPMPEFSLLQRKLGGMESLRIKKKTVLRHSSEIEKSIIAHLTK